MERREGSRSQKPFARRWVISGTAAPKALPAAGVARRRRRYCLFVMWASRKPRSLVGFLGYWTQGTVSVTQTPGPC